MILTVIIIIAVTAGDQRWSKSIKAAEIAVVCHTQLTEEEQVS